MEELDPMLRTINAFLALAAALFLGIAGPAHAGMIPAAVAVTPAGSAFDYSYHVILPSDYAVKNGDFFTVYDFHGFVSGTNVQPAGWTFGSSLLGPNPPHIAPGDDATVPNLTWTYHGADVSGPAELGDFSARSTLGPNLMDVDFASQDHLLAGGRAVGNFTTTSAPDVIQNPTGDPKQTPEPATLAMLGFGLPLALLCRLRRRLI
jgi:hypothetical protein